TVKCSGLSTVPISIFTDLRPCNCQSLKDFRSTISSPPFHLLHQHLPNPFPLSNDHQTFCLQLFDVFQSDQVNSHSASRRFSRHDLLMDSSSVHCQTSFKSFSFNDTFTFLQVLTIWAKPTKRSASSSPEYVPSIVKSILSMSWA